MYEGEMLNIVDSFKSLNISISYNGSFKSGVQELLAQAQAQFWEKQDLHLPIDIQQELYNALVAPILLYGCEVWGHQNVESIEKLHLKYLKYVLGVRRSTCNSIVYGGGFPLRIKAQKRLIGFYACTLGGNDAKLSHIMLPNLNNTMQATSSKSG